MGVGSIDSEVSNSGVGSAGFRLEAELTNRMPEMVKGWGYVRRGKRNVEPFSDWGSEATEADQRSRYVAKNVIQATLAGIANPKKIAAGFSPDHRQIGQVMVADALAVVIDVAVLIKR